MEMATLVEESTEGPTVELLEVAVVKDLEKVVAMKEMVVVEMETEVVEVETVVNEGGPSEVLMAVMLVVRMVVFVVEDTELDPEDGVVH